MKLRIKGNSLRLRLSQGDVTALATTGRIADATAFGPGDLALRYEIVTADDLASLEARLDGSRITLRLPRAQVVRWAESDEVTLEGRQPIDAEQSLLVVVEKDFQCLKPRTEDADAFAHPTPELSC